MPAAAPRLHPALIEELARLSRTRASPAEIRRALATLALELGRPPPSYEHVRRLVVLERLEREEESRHAEEVLSVAFDVALGIEHVNELLRVMRGGKRRAR